MTATGQAPRASSSRSPPLASTSPAPVPAAARPRPRPLPGDRRRGHVGGGADHARPRHPGDRQRRQGRRPCCAPSTPRALRSGSGFDEAHQAGADAVVMSSSSIRDDNVELVAARDRGLPVLHRAQGLAALMHDRRPVAVAGRERQDDDDLDAHRRPAALRPRPLVRGRWRARQARHQRPRGHRRRLRRRGRRERRLLPRLPPGGRGRHQRAARPPRLLRHFEGVRRPTTPSPPRSSRAACSWPAPTTPGSRELAERARAEGTRVRDLRLRTEADVRPARRGADGLMGRVTSARRRDGRAACRSTSPAGTTCSTPRPPTPSPSTGWGRTRRACSTGSPSFTGTRRRFEPKGAAGGVVVVDDYAHNPGKVAAVVYTGRALVGDRGRLVVVFQPHLYSRTRDFAPEFGAGLAPADVVVAHGGLRRPRGPVPGVSSGSSPTPCAPSGPTPSVTRAVLVRGRRRSSPGWPDG